MAVSTTHHTITLTSLCDSLTNDEASEARFFTTFSFPNTLNRQLGYQAGDM